MSTFGLTWNLKSPDRNKQFISNIPRMCLFKKLMGPLSSTIAFKLPHIMAHVLRFNLNDSSYFPDLGSLRTVTLPMTYIQIIVPRLSFLTITIILWVLQHFDYSISLDGEYWASIKLIWQWNAFILMPVTTLFGQVLFRVKGCLILFIYFLLLY